MTTFEEAFKKLKEKEAEYAALEEGCSLIYDYKKFPEAVGKVVMESVSKESAELLMKLSTLQSDFEKRSEDCYEEMKAIELECLTIKTGLKKNDIAKCTSLKSGKTHMMRVEYAFFSSEDSFRINGTNVRADGTIGKQSACSFSELEKIERAN